MECMSNKISSAYIIRLRPPNHTLTTKLKSSRTKTTESHHHGNLRQVLIDTDLRLLAQVGPENVTVRLLHRAETVVIEGKSSA